MEAKEKAKELVDKYKEFTEDIFAESYYQAKQCALIAVDEIIDLGLLYGNAPFGDGGKRFYSYWQEVKEEILKL